MRAELRIGNYFHPVSDGMEIHLPITDIVYRVGSVDKFGEVKVIEPGNEETHVFRKYAGVQITGEWLKKFGFENILPNHDGQVACNKYPITVNARKNNSIYVEYLGSCIRSHHIKYVHQLQNLYFALTGEELKYTP